MEKVIVAVFTSLLCTVMNVSDSKEDCKSKEPVKVTKEVVEKE